MINLKSFSLLTNGIENLLNSSENLESVNSVTTYPYFPISTFLPNIPIYSQGSASLFITPQLNDYFINNSPFFNLPTTELKPWSYLLNPYFLEQKKDQVFYTTLDTIYLGELQPTLKLNEDNE